MLKEVEMLDIMLNVMWDMLKVFVLIVIVWFLAQYIMRKAAGG